MLRLAAIITMSELHVKQDRNDVSHFVGVVAG